MDCQPRENLITKMEIRIKVKSKLINLKGMEYGETKLELILANLTTDNLFMALSISQMVAAIQGILWMGRNMECMDNISLMMEINLWGSFIEIISKKEYILQKMAAFMTDSFRGA